MTMRHLVYVLCAASAAHFACDAAAAVPVEESVAEGRVEQTEVIQEPVVKPEAKPVAKPVASDFGAPVI
ncbi:MAG: hypothetical protein O7E57_04550, partial [Gammaproteobacteria bacterium]|nr:hypothetical protein [Gammaproteobacteria bacterium]